MSSSCEQEGHEQGGPAHREGGRPLLMGKVLTDGLMTKDRIFVILAVRQLPLVLARCSFPFFPRWVLQPLIAVSGELCTARSLPRHGSWVVPALMSPTVHVGVGVRRRNGYASCHFQLGAALACIRRLSVSIAVQFQGRGLTSCFFIHSNIIRCRV